MKVLLITPPFTQLNTVYPATSYIKGFLNTLNVASFQVDLSLEVILNIFCKEGLQHIFKTIEDQEMELTDRSFRVFSQRKRYIQTIDSVIKFLQNQNPTLALTICADRFLPQGHRFENLEDMDWAFGSMGTHDKARHLSTLYLEDLGDLITEAIDPHFGFSRYAERLGRTATHFDEMYQSLIGNDSFVIQTMKNILTTHVKNFIPDLVCITMPFPGNVFSALKCGQLIKKMFPHTRVSLGGGYANTELRSVYDERVFEFTDFITLDDGEAPLQHLIQYIQGKRPKNLLKRTFCLDHGSVVYLNGSTDLDIPQRETGTPDYSDLKHEQYLSVIEVINPMHRMWSDGWWNKLTMAHGCYWGKCSFCDVTLDYIKRYEPISADILCDRMEDIMKQTGKNGFHFVDEAAPPALMRDLAVAILKRGLIVSWWANIRFEKSFTPDLCKLLRASGCIAISGGLEVASDRLLEKMKKGVTVAQVAKVGKAFTDAGIMVHAYLMYGFPTQTAQETIDSLEMVRQMFSAGVMQSGFWHLFAMTAHSPVGLHPAEYGVVHDGPKFGGFAENDFFHTDPSGAAHEDFADGLKVSLYNYMQGAGLDEPLDIWFDMEIPETKVLPYTIDRWLQEEKTPEIRSNDQVIWLGGDAIELIEMTAKKSKKDTPEYVEIVFSGLQENYSIYFERSIGEWWIELLAFMEEKDKCTASDLIQHFEQHTDHSWETWKQSDLFQLIREKGLLFV